MRCRPEAAHNRRMNTRALSLLAGFLVLLLLAVTPVDAKKRGRDLVFEEYMQALRWNEFDAAWSYVDHAIRTSPALPESERERLKQIEISGCTLRNRQAQADGSVEIWLEIRVVYRNTQVERIITDHQHWRWDAENKRFWLVSGLPDFDAG